MNVSFFQYLYSHGVIFYYIKAIRLSTEVEPSSRFFVKLRFLNLDRLLIL